MNEVELSIIIPIYNVEKYLEECLDSIYEIKNICYEVILINDGSTDKSYKIINRYLKKNSSNTRLINQNNSGPSLARNEGIKIAKGKYILLVDSDDFINAKLLESLFIKGKNDNLDIIIGNFNYYFEKCNIKIRKISSEVMNLKITTGKIFIENFIETNNFALNVEPVNNLYKRKLLLNNNIFFEVGILHEDELFSQKIFLKALKVKYYDIPFYFYRQRNDGRNSVQYSEKNISHNLWIIKEVISFMKKEKIVSKQINSRLVLIWWGYLRSFNLTNLNVYKLLILLKCLDIKSRVRLIFGIFYIFKAKKIRLLLK